MIQCQIIEENKMISVNNRLYSSYRKSNKALTSSQKSAMLYSEMSHNEPQ